jgi:hypothetical protein
MELAATGANMKSKEEMYESQTMPNGNKAVILNAIKTEENFHT